MGHKGLIAVIAAAGLAVGMPGLASARVIEAEAGKVFQFLDAYLSLPAQDRSGFQIAYRFVLAGTERAAPLKMTLMRGGEPVGLPITQEGYVQALPTLAEIKSHARIVIQGPDGAKISEQVDLLSTAPFRTDYAATDFTIGLQQANDGVHKAAGVFSMLAPRLTRVVFVGAVSGEVIDETGRSTPLPMGKEGPAFDPVAQKSARSIRLAKAPGRITFAAAKD